MCKFYGLDYASIITDVEINTL